MDRVASVSRLRTERLVNLIICLLSSRRYMSAEKIAATVPGYEHDASDLKAHEAFQRKFERDKAQLRRLGVPLQTGTNSVFDAEVGYRIARGDYELPEIEFLPDEVAVLGVAARLWQPNKLADDAGDALWKLRAAGIDIFPVEPEVAPVLTVDEAFSPVMTAVRQRQHISFKYMGRSDDAAVLRRIEPWGVVCYRGRWYVIGHDLDRDATRCFRLSRIDGQVKTHAKTDAFTVPADINLLESVARLHETREKPRTRRATVRVKPGRAAGVRRRAVQILSRQDGFDRIVVTYTDPAALARWLAGYGDAVTVVEPAQVRKEMAVLLSGIVANYEDHKDALTVTRPQ